MIEIKKNEKEEELRIKAKISKMKREIDLKIKCPWCGYLHYRNYNELLDDSDNDIIVRYNPMIILCHCKKYFKVDRKITMVKIGLTENEKNKTNGIEKLNEIAQMRGSGVCLIHRVIHQFNWFMNAVLHGETDKNKETQDVYKWAKQQQFHYDGENTLNKWIDLFYKWYVEIEFPSFEIENIGEKIK